MKLLFVTLCACVFVMIECANIMPDPSHPKAEIVFEATVLKIGPPVPTSGRISAYRLVKYRVQKVCQGQYDRKEIIVDHLVLTGKELEGIEIGERVWLTVGIMKSISPRYDAEGIRDKSKRVTAFYIARSLSLIPPSVCSQNR